MNDECLIFEKLNKKKKKFVEKWIDLSVYQPLNDSWYRYIQF